MTLYLVRHGETEWNLERRRQGRANSPLTPLGIDQARSAGRALRFELGDAPDLRVVSSPTGRAHDTARLIAAELGLDDTRIELDERLAECDLGDWTGLTSDEVEARDPGALARRELDKWSFRMPGGESYADVAIRARAWLDSLDQRPLVAVTHEMTGRTLCGLIQGLERAQVLDVRLAHGRAYRFVAGARVAIPDPGGT